MVDADEKLEGALNKTRNYSLANDAATPLQALRDKARVADIEAILSFGAKQLINPVMYAHLCDAAAAAAAAVAAAKEAAEKK